MLQALADLSVVDDLTMLQVFVELAVDDLTMLMISLADFSLGIRPRRKGGGGSRDGEIKKTLTHCSSIRPTRRKWTESKLLHFSSAAAPWMIS